MADFDYSRAEEVAHVATHGLGIAASLVGIAWLITAAAAAGAGPWRVTGGLVFGVSALILFTTSVAYHAARSPRLKPRLRLLDHSAIYLLIAGTYTPFALGVLGGAWGWTLFGLVWGLALVGILAKTTLGFRFPVSSVLLYLGMGWLGVIAARPLMQSLTPHELTWIVAGGLAYTAGVPFYLWKRPALHPRDLAPVRAGRRRVPLRGRAERDGAAPGLRPPRRPGPPPWPAVPSANDAIHARPVARARAEPAPQHHCRNRPRRPRRGAAAAFLDRSADGLWTPARRARVAPVRGERRGPRALADQPARTGQPRAARPGRPLQREAVPVLPAREDPRHAAEPAAQDLPVAARRSDAVRGQGPVPAVRQRDCALQRDAGHHAHGDLHVRLHRVGRGRLQGPRAVARDLFAAAEPDLDQPREPHRGPRGRRAVRRVPRLELQFRHGSHRRDAGERRGLPGRGAGEPQRLRRHLPAAARLVRQAEQPRRRRALVRRLHGARRSALH